MSLNYLIFLKLHQFLILSDILGPSTYYSYLANKLYIGLETPPPPLIFLQDGHNIETENGGQNIFVGLNSLPRFSLLLI